MKTSDRLPPYDLAAEQAILGCCLLDPQLVPELSREWFYDLRHQKVADALQTMFSQNEPIDRLTVTQRLQAVGTVPDAAALVADLDNACPAAPSFSHWKSILEEKATLRRMIAVCTETTGRCYEPLADANGVLDGFERDALAIRRNMDGASNGECEIKTMLQELTHEWEQALEQKRPPGLATGFYDLDRLLGGLKPQQLFVIAARPAIGKTSLAFNIAEHLAIGQGLPVVVFSLEMSAKELLNRLACSLARVDNTKLADGTASERDIQRLTTATLKIVKAPLHIVDRGGLTLSQLAAHARRMLQQHRVQLVIVDYLGLLRSGEKRQTRYEETTAISNGLKTLAKELNVPVIALAQLNRDTERENRAPRLSDLRDSGAIEQDGDIIGLLHRAESAGDVQTVQLIIAKNRTGRTGKVDLIFHPAFTRFESAATSPAATRKTA